MAGTEDRSGAFFKNVRQGHVFTLRTEEDGSDPERFVVISQTCDIVLSKRPTVILARVVELAGSERANAATETNPRLVPLPCLDDKHFADLCFVESRQKIDLLDLPYAPGIDLGNEQVKRDFSLSITRWFGRFPFPDEVVPWLRPLEQVVREKYRKQSALGELLRQVVVEIRVEELAQWDHAPYKIDIHTIVRAEALPTLPDDIADVSDFVQQLRESDDSVKAPAALAELYSAMDDVHIRHHVLHALAESLAALCTPANIDTQPEAVTTAVATIEWHLWGDDEFPLARIRKSEPLDLEYLSEPDQRV
ncbi:hypothetical protein A5790_05315 [Mycobacterium sp. 852002-51152_SCH6134967]|uniref:hypothetical protein n=1 Tax=Mycobacterium sp. 852002-51152_SCH6134967 TaxID=1834096 RepID=UPI0007FE7525|nr:hypothetical protein [Mycobacterium sp. 852002-51152_SCH6134967]OBF96449.1 hypothetical protein A5790_05315 [Mycobacterium sp. 852002-51152_SCH6134967]